MGMEMNRRKLLGGFATMGLLGGCRAGVPAKVASAILPPPPMGEDSLAAQLADVAEAMLVEYPQNATILGIATGAREPLNRRWQDQTRAGFEARKAAIGARLAMLRSLDLADLTNKDKLDGAVALQAHELAAQGYAFDYGDPLVLDPNNGFRNTPYVVNQLGSSFVDIPDFLDSRQVVETAADAEAFADRVDDYARNVYGETERLARDRGQGVVAPSFTLDKTILMIGGAAGERAETSGVVRTLEKKLAAAKLGEAQLARVTAAMRDKVIPAFGRQMDELKRHRAVATDAAGAWHIKDGEAYYAWALKAGTTTTKTPADIHALGLEQVKTIQSRMDAILKKNGMTKGTVGERMAALGTRPDQLFEDSDKGRADLLAYLNGRIADIRTRLPRAFATMVPGNLVIKRVPVAIQDGAPGGYAAAGSADGKVPGNYFINLKTMAEWPRYSLPTLTYHEGIPGHIWQGDYANRMALIRSMLAFNAYSEGWALYAEQLADELGAYDGDELGQLGYLQSQSFRACRLVVDTGLHAMRWTRDQAADWFWKTNGDERSSIVREVDRYCVMPGQACGYMIGRLEILRLREKAKALLGGRFDLRTFDDALVLGGSVPMTLLETVIDGYIARNRMA